MRAFVRPALRPYLPDLRFVRAVGQGTCVLCRYAIKPLVMGLRAAFAKPTQKAPEKAEQTDGGTGAEEKASPVADGLERLVAGALVLAGGGAATVTVLSGTLPRLAPYLPAAVAVGVPVWIVAAWVVAPPAAPRKPPTAPAEAPADPAIDTPEGRRLAFLRWLEKTTRNTPGMHLDQMHAALTQHEPAKDLPRHHLRPLLQHYGVPVQRTLRVGSVSGRSGVTRQAVLDALAAAEPAPPPEVGTEPVESPLHTV
jgi:hypothetical protein